MKTMTIFANLGILAMFFFSLFNVPGATGNERPSPDLFSSENPSFAQQESERSPTFTEPASDISAMSINPATAADLALAMGISSSDLVSASIGTSDPLGIGVGNSPLSYFPQQGGTFALLSTGLADSADLPNNQTGLSYVLGGANNSQGYDLVQLTLVVRVPNDKNCVSVDYAFYSEEFPEFVGSQFNDVFTIEYNGTSLAIAGNQTTSPLNFAFDRQGKLISVNTTYYLTGNTGTTYDGVTPLLKARRQVPAGQTIKLVFTVQDLGDPVYDSTVILDNFKWNYDTNCSGGSTHTSKPPLVLVHGWQGMADENISCDGIMRYPARESTLGDLAENFSGDYDVWIAHLESGPDGTASFIENADCLYDQLSTVYNDAQVNHQEITIVAHSMGGVVSRACISSISGCKDMVKELYTMGTPHAGFTDWALDFFRRLEGINCNTDLAYCAFSRSSMRAFNNNNRNQEEIESYVFLGGNGGNTSGASGNLIEWMEGENDGFVGRYNAVGWVWNDAETDPPDWASDPQPERLWTDEVHSADNPRWPGHAYSQNRDDTPSSHAYNCISWKQGHRTDPGYCTDADSAGFSESQILSSIESTIAISGNLNSGEVVSPKLVIDSNGSTVFNIAWDSGTLDLTLTAPDGITNINPGNVGSYPEVTYYSGLGSASYEFSTISPGEWTLNISAQSDVGIDGSDFIAYALMETQRLLDIETNADFYNVGDSASISAQLTGPNGGITGANVSAALERSDGNVDLLALSDQGGGNYSANYQIPNSPGYIQLTVMAHGSDSGQAFSRQEIKLLGVSSSTAAFNGTYSSQAVDGDTNGKYERLDISAGVDVSNAGSYSITADLLAGGQVVAHTGVVVSIPTGTSTITLPFSGNDIRTSRVNGPYVLSNLVVYDNSLGSIPQQTVNNAWITSAYTWQSFGSCHSLSINANPTFGGVVTKTPSPDCNGGTQYSYGTQVQLRAIPQSPYRFVNWIVDAEGTQNPIQIIINQDTVIAANFSNSSAPTIPQLSSPLNNALLTDYTPQLTWRVVTVASGVTFDHYQIQVDNDQNFSSPVIDDSSLTNILSTSFTPVDGLAPNTRFYWRVRAVNLANETSNWSAVWYFRTALTPPTLLTPATGIDALVLRPPFDWDDVIETGVTGYTIQISKNNTFTQIVHTANPTASSYTPSVDLPKGFTLFWRVLTRGANGPSAPSEVRSFNSANSPSTPVLSLPALNALNTNYMPLFKWSAVTLPVGTVFQHYQLQVDDNPDFASPVLDDTSVTTLPAPQFQSLVPFAHNSKFYWRVRAVNTDNEVSNWSAVWYFRTALTPPTLISPFDGEDVLTLRPTFDWEDVAETGLTGYTLQISRNNTFTLIVHTGNPVGSIYTPAVDLPKGVTLFWRVQTRGTYGPSAPSEVRSFNSANPPSTPTLSLPAPNALVTDYTPLFEWNNSTLPLPVGSTTFKYYEIQIIDGGGFELIYTTPIGDINHSHYTPAFELPHNTKFYWRVRAVNTDNEVSNWSSVWYFRTALTPPTLISPVNGEAVLTLRPTFDWEDVAETGLTGYTLQVSRNNTFTMVVHTGNPVASSYTPAVDLPKGVTLFWRVLTRGANGPSAWSEVRSFNSANSPSTPVLSLPALNALNTNYLPLFKWSAVTLPVGTFFQHYQLLVDDNVDFSSPVLNETIPNLASPQFQIVSPLPHNTKLYWRVRAVNTDNEVANWSTAWYFRTALTPPTLISPLDGEDVLTLRPTFDWDDVAETGLTGYTLQISRNNTFTMVVHTGNPVGSIYTPAVDLPKGVTLFWRVQTRGANGPSAWSEVRSFNSANSPSAPTPLLPAYNSLNTNYLPLFKWSMVTLPVGTVFQHYQLQVDDNADFSSPVLDDTSVTTLTPPQFQSVTPFDPNTKFFWRVRAVNTDNEVSNWSTVWYFRTLVRPPSHFSPGWGETVFSDQTPTFDWADATGPGTITGYTIQVSTSPTFSSLLVNATVVTSTYTPLTNLPLNTTLYWHVRTNGVNGPSLYSPTFNFTISP